MRMFNRCSLSLFKRYLNYGSIIGAGNIFNMCTHFSTQHRANLLD
jgi:hypothetical protein